jgi:hypothetical protein
MKMKNKTINKIRIFLITEIKIRKKKQEKRKTRGNNPRKNQENRN